MHAPEGMWERVEAMRRELGEYRVQLANTFGESDKAEMYGRGYTAQAAKAAEEALGNAMIVADAYADDPVAAAILARHLPGGGLAQALGRSAGGDAA